MSVTEAATQRIKEQIADGRLQPGQRLPSEPKLAAEFGVSRSSLREAIRGLLQARVLEVRRGDGTYVSSLEPEHLLGDLNSVFTFTQDSAILQLFEVRRLLGPATAALAALRATDEQVEEMKQSLDAMSEAQLMEELITFDYDFHNKIASCTGNTILCRLLEAMVSQSWWERFWKDVSDDSRAVILDQNMQIVRAIRARDPGLAAAATAIHLSTFAEWLRGEFVRNGDDVPDDQLGRFSSPIGVTF